MRKFIAAFVAVTMVTCFWGMHGQGQEKKPIREFMRQKLMYSQKVLEGLALENYETIATNSKSLATLSQAAEWQALPSPEYVRYSSEFQQLANELTLNANKKNIDGATLAYVQLTINCVKCHKHVRSQTVANVHSPILR